MMKAICMTFFPRETRSIQNRRVYVLNVDVQPKRKEFDALTAGPNYPSQPPLFA